MKNFIIKLRHIIFSWGSLKALCGIISLIILFYVEEDWRGARSLAATKAEWEAKGESFDLKALDLPPIPDDQNLALIPLFDQVSVKGKMTPVTLNKALENIQPVDSTPNEGPKIKFPKVNDWQTGKLPNLPEIQKNVSDVYLQVFHSAPTANPVDQLGALCPMIKDLRNAALTHPYCQFKIDQSDPCPMNWSLDVIIDQVTTSRALGLDAILALDNHQPDLALGDLKTTFDLAAGVNKSPNLIGGLVNRTMTMNNLAVIADGLALHAWSDAQLAEIQNELAAIDYLDEVQRITRGEAIVQIPDMDYLKGQSEAVREKMLDAPNQPPITTLWPSGWIDLATTTIVNFDLSIGRAFDPGSHRVHADQTDRLVSDVHGLSSGAPWNILVHDFVGYSTRTYSEFAHMQTMVDEAQIACALERFHLAHNLFPDGLEELKPYINNSPNDVINGQPYHYQLRADGSYLLYSVGWNQTDEGGKIVYVKNKLQIDQGDWVWPSNHN